jgi:hypothetical protein
MFHAVSGDVDRSTRVRGEAIDSIAIAHIEREERLMKAAQSQRKALLANFSGGEFTGYTMIPWA